MPIFIRPENLHRALTALFIFISSITSLRSFAGNLCDLALLGARPSAQNFKLEKDAQVTETEILPGLFLLAVSGAKSAAQTAMRFQETHESAVARGQVFSREDFASWHRENLGTPYENLWGAFSFPASAMTAFYAGRFSGFSAGEQVLLERFEDAFRRGENFSLIITPQSNENDNTVLTSDFLLALSLIQSHPYFRADLDSLMSRLPSVLLFEAKSILTKWGYHPDMALVYLAAAAIAPPGDSRHPLHRLSALIHLGPQKEIKAIFEKYFDRELELKKTLTSDFQTRFGVELKASGSMGLALFASRPVTAGEIIFNFEDAKIQTKDYFTVQVGPDSHVSHAVLGKLNHSCDPNVFLDVINRKAIALKDIAVGDLLSFFYPSTEWVMDAPFTCQCGAENCMGLIQGAKFLAPEYQNSFRLNPHIRQGFR